MKNYDAPMSAASGQAPQRVCPHCATVAATAADRCPWCERSYRRRTVSPVAALLLLQTVLIVGGIALLLVAFGAAVDDELDDKVERVERNLDRDFDGIQRDVRRELDRRLPPTVTPTP